MRRLLTLAGVVALLLTGGHAYADEAAPPVVDPAAERLHALIADQAAQDRAERHVAGGILLGFGGAMVLGGIPCFVFAPNEQPARPLFLATGVALEVTGALSAGIGALSFALTTSIEDLAVEYEPIVKTRADALIWGEARLSALAERERSARIRNGVLALTLGPAAAALGVVSVAFSSNSDLRLLSMSAFGLVGLVDVVSGIYALTVARYPAERLWRTWLIGTGRAPSARVSPWFSPTLGGAMIGVGLTL